MTASEMKTEDDTVPQPRRTNREETLKILLVEEHMLIAIEVENMLDFHQMCLDRGLKIVQEPTDYPWGHRIIRLQDPDGIILSFFAPIQD